MTNSIWLLVLLIVLSSCKKEEQLHSFTTYPQLTKKFTEGSWYIAVKDNKMPGDYAALSFHFNEDQSFGVNDKNGNYKGEWDVVSDSGTDDSPPTDLGINFLFTAYAPHKLEALGSYYKIINRTKDSIKLINEDAKHPCKIILYRKY